MLSRHSVLNSKVAVALPFRNLRIYKSKVGAPSKGAYNHSGSSILGISELIIKKDYLCITYATIVRTITLCIIHYTITIRCIINSEAPL